jgi:hypothetical protein
VGGPIAHLRVNFREKQLNRGKRAMTGCSASAKFVPNGIVTRRCEGLCDSQAANHCAFGRTLSRTSCGEQHGGREDCRQLAAMFHVKRCSERFLAPTEFFSARTYLISRFLASSAADNSLRDNHLM